MSQYRLGEMVLAKCQNYPYWPGKIITFFPNSNSYKVLFYGEKSEATIDATYIIPFNDQTYRKIVAETVSKTNKALRFSLSVAIKRFNKRKKGLNSSSEEDDFLQESELPRKSDASEPQKNKSSKSLLLLKQLQPEDPHVQLGVLLNALSNEASKQKNAPRVFTEKQERRLRELIDPKCDFLLLASLIELRVIERFIVTLKELDLWGLKEQPELNQLHTLVRNRYEEYKSIILGPEFAAIPLRETKRERIIQKVIQNKAVL